MSRPSVFPQIIMMTILVGLLLGLTAYGEKARPWVVLDFKMKGGQRTQMAFSNLEALNEDECRESLAKALDSLISAAIQKTPSLRRATIVGARCMMSVDDPIKRSG